jgi:uncharacterized protein
MTTFTPLSALAGGLLIGGAAVLLLALNGRIAGVSGIAAELVAPSKGGQAGQSAWRWCFLLGLIGGAGLWVAVMGGHPAPRLGFPPWALVLGGALVGFGTALAGGCTSGHGVCGLARFSVRSLVAVLVFLCTAFVTVYVTRHVLGLLP